MLATCLIPARFGSTRFPGKPLADETGKPLIRHVVERVGEARRVGRVVVATDDRRIQGAVEAFGGESVMTRADHPNGTARLAEAADALGLGDQSLVVNVQGDEPEIEPGVIDRLIDGLAGDDAAAMATLASPFAAGEDPADPNIVKLVTDQRGRAIYFSRAPIPHPRGVAPGPGAYLKHPGCYAYRRWFLPVYAALPATPLERAEQLEQLRVLEHGHAIAVVRAVVAHHGIDTPAQYAEFVKRRGA